ncbi:MAG TPA: sigma-54 dependent transcriptional regulator [Acidobacteriaceae bacterium]|jgi:DNA-binding NtrC family response regulator|nr:sigma-54 dependent transcriptional regulator [Acidobacteriaceae bacterium]
MTGETQSSVMVVDDEPGIRTALRANFLRHAWQVETASGVSEAVRRLEQRDFDLIVTDIRMPDGSGMEVMRAARRASPTTAVILLTAYGSVPDAVKAMRDGALDYLTKPISFDHLQTVAAQVMERAQQPIPLPHQDPAGGGDSGDIVGRSPLLLRALQRARAAASTGADVLIEAESGTGKELLARFIHEASDRSHKPFVAVNCAALPEALLESELFGHGRGAFTGAVAARPGKFEAANGGTILLDEIGEMPLNLQPKLLRALQEREFQRLGEGRSVRVDIRVIATTNVSLAEMVEHGQFRPDLYYRLNVIPLSLPPLRERRDDIPVLARHFTEQFAARLQRGVPRLDPEFLNRLQTHDWPGNVRELANFMRRVMTLSGTLDIDERCFDTEFQSAANANRPLPAGPAGLRRLSPGATRIAMPAPAGTPIRELEKLHLENTLALTDGNRTHAAEMLGISLRTLRNKIREYGLPPRRYA